MEHLNFVHIRGNVGSVQLVPYGEKKQAALSVATNYGYMDKDGIALIETTWFHVTAIEGVAAPLDTLQRIERGSAVEVKGRFRAKRYVNATGEEKISYQVVASELNLKDEK